MLYIKVQSNSSWFSSWLHRASVISDTLLSNRCTQLYKLWGY